MLENSVQCFWQQCLDVQVDSQLVGSYKICRKVVRWLGCPPEIALYPKTISHHAAVSVPQSYAKARRDSGTHLTVVGSRPLSVIRVRDEDICPGCAIRRERSLQLRVGRVVEESPPYSKRSWSKVDNNLWTQGVTGKRTPSLRSTQSEPAQLRSRWRLMG